MRALSFLKFAVGFLLFTTPALASEPLCRNANPALPALSFSLISYRPGDLDRICGSELDRARMLGFTAVSLTPSIVYDPDTARLHPERTLRPGEITRCLERAYEQGFDITYVPHLEGQSTIDGTAEGATASTWRSRFRVHPDESYESAVLGDVLTWLEAHREELRAGGPRIDLTLTAELGTSNGLYGDEWTALSRRVRDRLAAAGLRQPREGQPVVRVGGNTIRASKFETRLSDEQCRAYGEFIGQLDYASLSFYPNMTRATGGPLEFEQALVEYESDLIDGTRINPCPVPQYSQIPRSVAEFGVGGNLGQPYSQEALDVSQHPTIFRDRAAIFRSLLTSLRQGGFPGHLPFNFWTLGVHDPVGVGTYDGSRHSPRVIDWEIVRQFRRYTEERCPGISLPDLGPFRDVHRTGTVDSAAPDSGICKPLASTPLVLDDTAPGIREVLTR